MPKDYEEVIREMAADLAVVKFRVECIPDLVERLEILEKNDLKRTSWAAAAGALVSGALWLATRLQLFVLLLAFGCAPVPLQRIVEQAPAAPLAGLHWEVPVAVVADVALGEECLAAIYSGIQFWEAAGVRKVQGLAVLSDVGPAYGFVTVSTTLPREEHFVASTTFVPLGDKMLWADIRFRPGYCTPVIAAHELGHALGLRDDYTDLGNVMFWEESGQGLGVTQAQVEQIK